MVADPVHVAVDVVKFAREHHFRSEAVVRVDEGKAVRSQVQSIELVCLLRSVAVAAAMNVDDDGNLAFHVLRQIQVKQVPLRVRTVAQVIDSPYAGNLAWQSGIARIVALLPHAPHFKYFFHCISHVNSS
ncbi:hypothetical protein LRU_01941 [Ligilactobacillus ruminis SPM0211]|uniref:Uncharacterized protein n=1 Tax=Ligilactobacillus ruminis SPM0211 TaxID=1040964 RepID=F7R2L0_9LACO|nr:hypothetical protein LRU_01941 [Ligilactobacillus ruminis SPM0211]